VENETTTGPAPISDATAAAPNPPIPSEGISPAPAQPEANTPDPAAPNPEPQEPTPGQKVGRIMQIPVDLIVVDGAIQQRAGGINQETVDDYAEQADKLPPIRVWHDGKQPSYILSDGFTRLAAWVAKGWQIVPCEVMRGERRDALLDAVMSNKTHGQRRSRADVERAVCTLMADPEWSHKTVAWIADVVGCSWATAEKWMEKYGPKDAKRTGRDDKQYGRDAGGRGTGGATVADDRTGRRVPKRLVPVFSDTRLLRASQTILVACSRIEKTDSEYAICKLPLTTRTQLAADIRSQAERLYDSLPYAVCPDCKGKEVKADTPRCERCGIKGWITEREYGSYLKSRGEMIDPETGKVKTIEEIQRTQADKEAKEKAEKEKAEKDAAKVAKVAEKEAKKAAKEKAKAAKGKGGGKQSTEVADPSPSAAVPAEANGEAKPAAKGKGGRKKKTAQGVGDNGTQQSETVGAPAQG
jgi:hypothetical protein